MLRGTPGVTLIEDSLLIDGCLNCTPQIFEEHLENVWEKVDDFLKDFESRGDMASIPFGLCDLSD